MPRIGQSSRTAAQGFTSASRACSRESVDQFHAAGVASGGRDNGLLGIRSDYGPGYYAAFLVDPDGYRLEAYFAERA